MPSCVVVDNKSKDIFTGFQEEAGEMMKRGPSEIPMVSRVLLVRFTNIGEGLTEMEIIHDICH